jgi:hypothetical protein
MANTDEQLRGRLLSICHQLRNNAGGWVPTSDMNFGGLEAVTPGQIAGICEQLAAANLITFKPLAGEGHFIVGMSKITGHGVDVVEGLAIPTIAVSFSSNAPTLDAAAHPLAGIHPTRIANWEKIGVDAIEADLKYSGGTRYVGGPAGTAEQAWRWVNYKQAENLGNVTPNREITGWPRVDRTIAEANSSLRAAKTEEQFQSIALLCREALISAAQAVYQPSLHPTVDGVEASSTDAKRMLEAYINKEATGDSAESRKHVKSSVALAVNLQHKRTASFRDAASCLEATTSVINHIAILSGARDPSDSN